MQVLAWDLASWENHKKLLDMTWERGEHKWQNKRLTKLHVGPWGRTIFHNYLSGSGMRDCHTPHTILEGHWEHFGECTLAKPSTLRCNCLRLRWPREGLRLAGDGPAQQNGETGIKEASLLPVRLAVCSPGWAKCLVTEGFSSCYCPVIFHSLYLHV